MRREKKSKYPKKENFKVWRGKKNVSVEFRVFWKKMKIEREVPGKKKVFFWWKFKVKDFAKFVFTGWALC